MLRFITSASILFYLSFGAFGQTASNFTLTDMDGTTHNLFNYLDAGKAVVIDFTSPLG